MSTRRPDGRPLLAQTLDKVMVFAKGGDGILHLAAYSVLLGVRLQDKPPVSAPASKSWPNTG
jgi:hypothetical protein